MQHLLKGRLRSIFSISYSQNNASCSVGSRQQEELPPPLVTQLQRRAALLVGPQKDIRRDAAKGIPSLSF